MARDEVLAMERILCRGDQLEHPLAKAVLGGVVGTTGQQPRAQVLAATVHAR